MHLFVLTQLLPTGGGKSLCYQLPALTQTGTTVVVCPIKSLMRDQVDELKRIGITRVAYMTSDQSSEERQRVRKRLLEGKLQFVFVSPERFQQPEFREALKSLNTNKRLGYIVIDEVHCLSEWGHDFRVAYLTLANTIRSVCKGKKVICLTATASLAVLEDIQIEFSVEDMNVKYLPDFSREELTFEVRNDNGKKLKELKGLLANLHKDGLVTPEQPGIIFTSAVNGANGCWALKNEFASIYEGVGCFSGSTPDESGLTDQQYDDYKREVQDKFKNNELSLLFATKAFGMGVNKKNVRFTIHFGMPPSVESLYQEAGRAGRDKQAARCFTLFEKSPDELVHAVEDRNKNHDSLKELNRVYRYGGGDINKQIFFLTKDATASKDFSKGILQVLNELKRQHPETSCVSAEHFKSVREVTSTNLEKILYRLSQLGFVEDWTVSDFRRSIYAVDFNPVNLDEVVDHFIRLVKRYKKVDPTEELSRMLSKFPNEEEKLERLIKILLDWNYKHFTMNRRQSLKTLHELCGNFSETGSVEFKKALEGYFRLDGVTHELQKIADMGVDQWPAWLDVFYTTKDTGKADKRLKNAEEITQLKYSLARFLESYHASPGLNFVSGVCRLLLREYDDADGSVRLCDTLNTLDSTEYRDSFLVGVCSFVSELDDTLREPLMFDLCRQFSHKEDIITIHKIVDDDISGFAYVRYFTQALKDITGSLQYGY